MPFYSVTKGITRFEPETGARVGFLVRICRNGKRINEFFADKAYGGKRKSLVAAEARYAELIAQYGPSNQHTTRDILTDRNTTGYVGVHLAKSVDTIWSNNEYFAYCASWVDEDKRRRKIAFSISKHGKKGALELAVLARKKRSTDREKLVSLYEKQKSSGQSSTATKKKTAKKKAAK
jgi:hypothetical protein